MSKQLTLFREGLVDPEELKEGDIFWIPGIALRRRVVTKTSEKLVVESKDGFFYTWTKRNEEWKGDWLTGDFNEIGYRWERS